MLGKFVRVCVSKVKGCGNVSGECEKGGGLGEFVRGV